MPVYEYLCNGCGHEFEREQRISDKPVRRCPACGAQKAKRLISRTSFVLKGGGWYSDLYATPKAAKSEGGDGASESKPESKAESKPESKAEGGASKPDGAKPSGGGKSGSKKGSAKAA